MTDSDRLHPKRIHESWLISTTSLAIYRTIALMIVLYTILYTMAYSSVAHYLLFATHWNSLLILAFFILATVTNWHLIRNRKLTTATFIVFETSIPIAFVIVVSAMRSKSPAFKAPFELLTKALYWGAINTSLEFESVNLALSSVQNHGIVSALVYIDLFLNNAVVKARDVSFPILVTILYLPLNAAWAVLTGRPIYPYIDWNSIWTLYVVFIAFALIILVHVTVWFVTYTLRPDHEVEAAAGEPKIEVT